MLFQQIQTQNKLPEAISIITPKKLVEIEQENMTQQDILVDIKGEVNHPGVYHMTSQDRILNVIDKAGGLTTKANTNTINLSAKVTDEMMIYIPSQLENTTDSSQLSTTQHTDKININQADVGELQNIPGIGATKAQSIVDYRQQHRFHQIEEIKEIEGIGDKLFERIKNKIAV